jgi:hypothetical protein
MNLFCSGRRERPSSLLPEGPHNPVNHSGTQINFWGVPPGDVSNWANVGGMGGMGGLGGHSIPYEAKLGALTNKMLQVSAVTHHCKPLSLSQFC